MLYRTLLLAALLLTVPTAFAEIVIAQVSPSSGPLSVTAKGNFEGAQACFEAVNAQGGVNGQKIRFVYEDDHYRPEETVAAIENIARRDQPLAFVNLFGSANTLAVQSSQVLERLKIPAVGVTPGADALRQPGSPWIFHVHASDQAQIRRVLRHLSTLGLTRVAAAYQDNPFGKSGLTYFDEAVKALNLTVTARVPVAPVAEKLQDVAQQLQASGAQTYVMLLVRNSAASLVRDVRAQGDKTPMYGLSYVPVEAIARKVPLDSAVGIGLAQILPDATSRRTLLTRTFNDDLRKYVPSARPSNPHLTGYVAARIVVEAIRRSGPSPTPEKVGTALKQLHVDLGGFTEDFTDGDNVGSQWVDIGVFDAQGRLLL